MQEGLNFIVEGGTPLSGSVETSRSKNGAVALLAASLLNAGTTTLRRVPKIEEVHRLIEVLRSLGVSVEWRGSDITITPPAELSLDTIDRAAAMKTRSILMFIGPLLHQFDRFVQLVEAHHTEDRSEKLRYVRKTAGLHTPLDTRRPEMRIASDLARHERP